MITYRIDLSLAHAHRFIVTLQVAKPQPQVVLELPVWIPGSYLIREFARHFVNVRAECNGAPVAIVFGPENGAIAEKLVYEASREIRSAIVFGTAVVVLSFLPLFALSGLEGRLFVPLSDGTALLLELDKPK